MENMSGLNGSIPCLGELTVGQASGPRGGARQRPACDFAEARVWDALGARVAMPAWLLLPAGREHRVA